MPLLMPRNEELTAFVIIGMLASCIRSQIQVNEVGIRESLVEHLGLVSTPNMEKANVSLQELRKMYHIYRQSVHQTKIAKRLHRKFLRFDLSKSSQNIVLNSFTRQKRSTFFPKEIILAINQSLIPSHSIISEAKLGLSVQIPNDDCKISIKQVVGIDDQGIALDSVSLNGKAKEIDVILDISHAVQAWSLRPKLNKGLKLALTGCKNIKIFKEGIDIVFTKTHVRHKRSPKRHRSRGIRRSRKNLCKRKIMKVSLTKLGGFDFIFMPKKFNAAMCSGKCPPRYKPLSDHSLLQSLVGLRSGQGQDYPNRSPPSPCCSPSAYESLDILHLDDQDPTKLKVTNWKNIKVSQCACA